MPNFKPHCSSFNESVNFLAMSTISTQTILKVAWWCRTLTYIPSAKLWSLATAKQRSTWIGYNSKGSAASSTCQPHSPRTTASQQIAALGSQQQHRRWLNWMGSGIAITSTLLQKCDLYKSLVSCSTNVKRGLGSPTRKEEFRHSRVSAWGICSGSHTEETKTRNVVRGTIATLVGHQEHLLETVKLTYFGHVIR